MRTPTFIILFGIIIAAYCFGDFNTYYGLFPEGGSTFRSIIKGLLAAAAAYLLIKKMRDFIRVSADLGFVIVGIAGAAGYFYESGKEQRVGRSMLAKYFTAEAAKGATITFSEKAKWLDSYVLIGFNRGEMNQNTIYPGYRKIPHCNIEFPGAERLFSLIPKTQLNTTNFYWTTKSEGSGFHYNLIAVGPDNSNWFYKSSTIEGKVPDTATIENARVYIENGAYVDRECGTAPFQFHKKAYTSQNKLFGEWDEKVGAERFNELAFDRAGSPLNGQVDAEFVYFVDKSEAFQKGFGKAGMVKCVGYYAYKQGKKHGRYEFYYPGRIARAFVGEYANGEQVGVQKQFNPNGSLKESWNVSPTNEASNAEASTLSR